MKLAFAAILLSLSLSVVAQTSAPETKTPSPGAPAPNMHQQHMQEMKDHIAKMRDNVTQMRANAAKIKDPATRQQAQLNADMWDGMVTHMEAMQTMMDGGPGGMGMMHGGPGGMGMMHEGMAMGGPGHEMGCCAAMMGSHSDHEMAMKDGPGGSCGKMQGGSGCCAGMQHGDMQAPPPATEQPKPDSQPK